MLIPPYGLLTCDKPLSLTLSPKGREDKKEFPPREGSANEQRAKQQREGGGVAVPLFASEQDRGSKGVGESMPSPSPARGEGNALHPSLKKKPAFTLAEGATHVDTTDNVRRVAFTLAEVLITLGIIGVVAAMTMPVLMSKYREKVFLTQLKKMVAIVEQMLVNINYENGSLDIFESCYDLELSERRYCYSDIFIKYSSVNPDTLTFKDVHPVQRYIYFADGSRLNINAPNEGARFNTYNFDVNGDKGPNKGGIDQFEFHFYPSDNNYVLHPLISRAASSLRNELDVALNYCKNSNDPNSATNTAYFCAIVILANDYKAPKNYPLRF